MMKHMALAALIAAGISAAAAGPSAAQTSAIVREKDRVTSTSGEPARIAAIRAHFDSVERELPEYRKVSRELEGFSLEGGNVEGAFDGDDLRKVTARHFGETWRGTEEYYFSGGELQFVFIVHELYDEQLSGKVEARTEHRLYYDDGRLIRRVRKVLPAGYPHDLSPRDPDLEQVPLDARQFAACVRATGNDPVECVGENG